MTAVSLQFIRPLPPAAELRWLLPVGDNNSPLLSRNRCKLACGAYPGPCEATGARLCEPPLGMPPAWLQAD